MTAGEMPSGAASPLEHSQGLVMLWLFLKLLRAYPDQHFSLLVEPMGELLKAVSGDYTISSYGANL